MENTSLVTQPTPGTGMVRFVGDQITFTAQQSPEHGPATAWRAYLRTNLGRARTLREEVIRAHSHGAPLAGASWHDIPMRADPDVWRLEIPLAEPGYFRAKPYLLDPEGRQHWPDGPDVGISVHPDHARSANTIYCAFTRLFGPTKSQLSTTQPDREETLRDLETAGFAVIPSSGTFRDLVRELPHIVETLGCRILHLLPVNPTPTTYARFGRFGSPYAALDLTAVDPALIEFDRRTTGIEQFCELARAVHARDARLFIDIVINHTGWGSTLQERKPQWFERNPDGTFKSPGAWGNTWEDLVELCQENAVELWDEIAEALLTWCRRGVDGFRCDAGYMVPVPAWQYLVARVQQEFPETVFLLEGLGGAWEATEALLKAGGMQWAYSELFQNYNGDRVSSYLDHSLSQSQTAGLLVHYSETHDNNRLAQKGRAWSVLRNRLCALASVNGGFGFTCGVEWLAPEKIDVHSSRGLAWGNSDNIVAELASLNRLLLDHPCFFDGARISRLSAPDSTGLALLRQSAEGLDKTLIMLNLDVDKPCELEFSLDTGVAAPGGQPSHGLNSIQCWFDLLGQPTPAITTKNRNVVHVTLAPGSAYCLAPTKKPRGLAGRAYREARARAAWGIKALGALMPPERVSGLDWRRLAAQVDQSPANFLSATSALSSELGGRSEGHRTQADLDRCFAAASDATGISPVVTWCPEDCSRVTLVPPGHWLLILDRSPFRARLCLVDERRCEHVDSLPAASGHIACFAPRHDAMRATLVMERYGEGDPTVCATLQHLPEGPEAIPETPSRPDADRVVLLTNGRGGMARLRVDLGAIQSKYDCALAANLHPELPVDRHVFVKRLRIWVRADGFLSPLNLQNLESFAEGPPAAWRFSANAGDGRKVDIVVRADMTQERNTTVFEMERIPSARTRGKPLRESAEVCLVVRPDIEDRSFHSETKRTGGADHHFSTHVSNFNEKAGFAFKPAKDRHLRVFATGGTYHPQPEWSEGIPHPVEASRGQEAYGDAYSPGWFEIPLNAGGRAAVVLTAESEEPTLEEIESATRRVQLPTPVSEPVGGDVLGQRLRRAIKAYVVKRGQGRSVVAGYPWFLDWGRDALICARGLVAAGLVEDVRDLLLTFARFEDRGTLPNTIHGQDASNRNTSDAPLWFGVACEELAEVLGETFYQEQVDQTGRTIQQVLASIADHYSSGTPNGVVMDPASALIWSPSHFTWMDTNFPAGTPRQGYPVEIQALWLRLLRQLERRDRGKAASKWKRLADTAEAAFLDLYWLDDLGWFSDVLLAEADQPAAVAVKDDALRSNGLFVVSLGLETGTRARRCVEAARRHLVVPGALRSLAPLPVKTPLPITSASGKPLNNPHAPYWGRYEGDEDTRRKPAYHNGTAWTWTFPSFCEALARAWDFSPAAVATARSYLSSMAYLLDEGCLGHLPEILDGDAPHQQRGCDAQAWGSTEALRVWRLLNAKASASGR